MRVFGSAIDLSPDGMAHAGAGDPHPAVPAGFSRGEKVRSARTRLRDADSIRRIDE